MVIQDVLGLGLGWVTGDGGLHFDTTAHVSIVVEMCTRYTLTSGYV